MGALDQLRGMVQHAPEGTMISLPVTFCAAVLEEVADPAPSVAPVQDAPPASLLPSWRERLWTAPADMRLGLVELAEALGRSRSWVYRHTSESRTTGDGAPPRLPHRKLEGELVFVVGEIRHWLEEQEQVVEPGASPVTLRAVPGRRRAG